MISNELSYLLDSAIWAILELDLAFRDSSCRRDGA